MKVMIRYYYLFFILVYFRWIIKADGKEIIIKNNDEIFIKIHQLFHLQDNITLKFVDEYYDFSKIEATIIDLPLHSNLELLGNAKGTVFDFKKSNKGSFNMSIFEDVSFKVENIIFENYASFKDDSLYLYLITIESGKYNIEFNHCTFRNNEQQLITTISKKNNEIKEIPQIKFNNCNFYNNTKKIYDGTHDVKKHSRMELNSSVVKLSNCRFVNNKNLFRSSYYHFYFENCYFSNMDSIDNESQYALYYGTTSKDLLKFNNTVFENINVQHLTPLIHGERVAMM